MRTYQVLSSRSPRFYSTFPGGLLGALSHVFVDAFTHRFRWGSNLLGLNGTLVDLPVRGPLSGAQTLQYLGHVLGSLLFISALVYVASSGKLTAWYGERNVKDARSTTTTARSSLLFWCFVLLPPTIAGFAAPRVDRSALFVVITTPVSYTHLTLPTILLV